MTDPGPDLVLRRALEHLRRRHAARAAARGALAFAAACLLACALRFVEAVRLGPLLALATVAAVAVAAAALLRGTPGPANAAALADLTLGGEGGFSTWLEVREQAPTPAVAWLRQWLAARAPASLAALAARRHTLPSVPFLAAAGALCVLFATAGRVPAGAPAPATAHGAPPADPERGTDLGRAPLASAADAYAPAGGSPAAGADGSSAGVPVPGADGDRDAAGADSHDVGSPTTAASASAAAAAAADAGALGGTAAGRAADHDLAARLGRVLATTAHAGTLAALATAVPATVTGPRADRTLRGATAPPVPAARAAAAPAATAAGAAGPVDAALVARYLAVTETRR
jgi:hypothetical protein